MLVLTSDYQKSHTMTEPTITYPQQPVTPDPDKYIRVLTFASFLLLMLLALNSCQNNASMGITDRLTTLAADGELIVQLAELEIDPVQLDSYLEFLVEGQQTSMALEPGVLTMYSLADRKAPTTIKIVEVYENQSAYESHLASPHFQQYKQGTAGMVKSLTLTRMDPLVFAAKPR
jgi:quinol monooxygenase YgiN